MIVIRRPKTTAPPFPSVVGIETAGSPRRYIAAQAGDRRWTTAATLDTPGNIDPAWCSRVGNTVQVFGVFAGGVARRSLDGGVTWSNSAWSNLAATRWALSPSGALVTIYTRTRWEIPGGSQYERTNATAPDAPGHTLVWSRLMARSWAFGVAGNGDPNATTGTVVQIHTTSASVLDPAQIETWRDRSSPDQRIVVRLGSLQWTSTDGAAWSSASGLSPTVAPGGVPTTDWVRRGDVIVARRSGQPCCDLSTDGGATWSPAPRLVGNRLAWSGDSTTGALLSVVDVWLSSSRVIVVPAARLLAGDPRPTAVLSPPHGYDTMQLGVAI